MPTITDLTGPAGHLEAVLDQPALRTATGAPRAAVVFAHPHPQYGGTMHTKAGTDHHGRAIHPAC